MLKYDEIGYWSEVKLDIIKEYASAYSKILTSQNFYHIYIDAFAGAGKHISKNHRQFVLGSPMNALLVDPPFKEYHFIDLDEQKIESLEEIAGSRNDVYIYHGDCNQILLDDIINRVKYSDYRRALCILDPYAINLDWNVILAIGKMRTFDIFLNFQVMDINRNILWKKIEKISEKQLARMNKFWGDDSWKSAAYIESQQGQIFGDPEIEKTSNEVIAEAFRQRLRKVAGFGYVPKPIPMRNSKNAVIYYLFFASHKAVAQDIVKDIFMKYENRKS